MEELLNHEVQNLEQLIVEERARALELKKENNKAGALAALRNVKNMETRLQVLHGDHAYRALAVEHQRTSDRGELSPRLHRTLASDHSSKPLQVTRKSSWLKYMTAAGEEYYHDEITGNTQVSL